MLNWLAENAGNLVVSLAVFGACLLAVRKIIRDRKQGVSSCGGNCGGCGLSGSCHDQGGENPLVTAFRKDHPASLKHPH